MSSQVFQKPSLSSLPLQVALHFNALFSLFFAVIVGSCSVHKIMYYNKRVSLSIVIIWSVFEPFRLYYGFTGNLKEKVPDLATYLLMTLFPQLPFVLYLAYIQPVLFPVDPILGTLMLVFLVAQFILGFHAMRIQIRSHTAQFMRLCAADDT